MKRTIVANARYWLDYLNASAEDDLIPKADIRGAARALEAVAAIPEAWSLTQALALALHPHMERRGYWADWDGFLQGLIGRARGRGDLGAEAELLIRRGAVQRQRGDYQGAVTSYRQAWWFCRRSRDEPGRANTLSNLGALYRLREYFFRAEVLCQGALALFEALGDTARLAQTENHLGLVYFSQGRWPEALLHLTRSKALLEQTGDWHSLARTLQNLGVLYRRTGDLEAALVCFRQAIHRYQMVGDETHVARTRLNIGNIYLNQSDLLRAERAYSQAEIVLKRIGDSVDLARARHNLGMVYTRLESWDEAEACFNRALDQWRNVEDTWNQANTLGELAVLHLACGRRAQAQACLDQAWELIEERSEVLYETLRRELVERRRELRRSADSGTV